MGLEIVSAFLLGLRHAAEPDHLVAVTALVASGEGDARKAMRLGAWWGAGHAAVLMLLGLPLIALRSELPGWLEHGAETAIGIVIVALAVRMVWTRVRGGRLDHDRLRSPRQAVAIGLLHGLAGTGAVVLLLVAALPSQAGAAAALAVFAPMSIVSMAGITAGLGWLCTRRAVEPIYRAVLIPALGILGVAFGLWYAGVA